MRRDQDSNQIQTNFFSHNRSNETKNNSMSHKRIHSKENKQFESGPTLSSNSNEATCRIRFEKHCTQKLR